MRNIITLNDVHQQFAEYFDIPALKPYAYLLSKKGSEGHICLDLGKINEERENLPEAYKKMDTNNSVLESIPLVGLNGNDRQPFVMYRNRLYLQRYFRYETGFLQRIQQFLDTEKALLLEREALLKSKQALIRQLFAGNGNNTADWQLAAAVTGVLALLARAGTAKNTATKQSQMLFRMALDTFMFVHCAI